MKVIGVTSVQHSSASPSRHSSGQKLYEVADIVIDTHASLADASIRIDGLQAPVGANSTSITIAIAHAIVLGHGRETGAARLGAVRDGQPQHTPPKKRRMS